MHKAGVNIGEEVFLTPLHAEDVGAGGIGGVEGGDFLVRPPPCVVGYVRAPVESAGDNVVAAHGVAVIVSPAFRNVDFTAGGPVAVGVVDGQEPDGGPQPVAFWHHRCDFHAPVFYGGTFQGIDTAGLGGGNDGAVGGVCDSVTCVEVGRCASSAEGEVVVRCYEGFVLKSGFDDEFAVLNKDIFFCAGCFIEFAIA